MPFNLGSPLRVQPYFGYRNDEQLVLSARALRAGKFSFDPAGRIQAVRTMLAQFASREVRDLEVTLEIERHDGERFAHSAVTDKEGFVHFEAPLQGKWAAGEHSTWEVVTLRWRDHGDEHCVHGHVLVPGRAIGLGVISDIDDTIIETGITGSFRAIARNWRRVVAQLPDERVAVPGADIFYNALGGGTVLEPGEASDTGARVTASRRPFFYVSSSPWNLFSYLVAFKRSRGLPLGPLMLRDWGLNRETFGSSSHGSHKSEAIERILAHYPELRFALIGDDTQGDLTAFGALVEKQPERIAAVFIRKAASEELSAQEEAAKSTIESSGVPLWIGPDYREGQDFLRQTGLADEAPAANIVSTTGEDEA